MWQFQGVPAGPTSSIAYSEAVDATDAFFMLASTDAQNGIDRVSVCGGPVENISPASYADQMAIDDLFVYTVDSSGGIHRTAK